MPLLHRTAVFLLALGALGPAGLGDASSLRAFERTPAVRVAAVPVTPPDTLRVSTTSDRPLIQTLPAKLNGHPADHYTLLRGPALSGVAGRSFTWIPKGAEPGLHEAVLQSHAPDAPPDTLVLRIDLQS